MATQGSHPLGDVRGETEAPTLNDRPIGDLVKQLSDQMSTLVRQELDLAKAELTVKGKRAGLGAGMFGGASVFSAYGAGALTACLILVLATAMTAWLAALIIAAVYGVVAGVLALMGRAKIRQSVPPMPEQTVESVKEDVELTKQRVKEGRR